MENCEAKILFSDVIKEEPATVPDGTSFTQAIEPDKPNLRAEGLRATVVAIALCDMCNTDLAALSTREGKDGIGLAITTAESVALDSLISDCPRRRESLVPVPKASLRPVR